MLQTDEFWKFIDRLRQGRRLLITADRGYAVSKLFSTEERDAGAIAIKKLTAYYIPITCPDYGHEFNAELCETRMAPGIERVVG